MNEIEKKCRKCATSFTVWEMDEEDDSFFEDCPVCREKEAFRFIVYAVGSMVMFMTFLITIGIEYHEELNVVGDSVSAKIVEYWLYLPSVVATFLTVGFLLTLVATMLTLVFTLK